MGGLARIGLFGGTFNPIHMGHLRLAGSVADLLHLDKVLFIPAAMPPHKDLAEGVTGEHRLAMARLAAGCDPRFSVSEIEVRRGGESYTLATLEALRQSSPRAGYTFLIGTDAYREIASWFRVERVLPLADWAVMRRPGTRMSDLGKPLGRLAEVFENEVEGSLRHRDSGTRIFFVDIPRVDISSTRIRRDLRRGRRVHGKVPEEVEAYIAAEGLYRGRPLA